MFSFKYNIFVLFTRVCYQTYTLILGARKNSSMKKNLSIHICILVCFPCFLIKCLIGNGIAISHVLG